MKSKKTIKRRIAAALDQEPKWEKKEKPTQHDIITAMNWYNVERDEKDAAKYLKTTPSIAKNFLSFAWVMRMLDRGFTFPKKSMETIEDLKIRFGESSYTTPNNKDSSVPVVSIQDRIKSKTDDIIGEMEGLVDQYGIRGDHKQLNVYQWFLDNSVKSVHANKIIEYFNGRSREILDVASGKNKEIMEYYSDWSKKRINNLVSVYESIIKDAEKLATNASKERKPRKKKPISFDKMVAKLNFMKKFDPLKLQSVDPVKVVGAIQLWVYNTKTRKLGVYNAIDSSGLKVRGSSIMNYQEDVSISKTVRKPEKVIQIVADGGKIALRKVLDGINSKPTELTGRINKDTILLRVI